MPSNPLSVYAEWVRRNPAAATSAENVSRMFALIFANPESLLSMEGNWCVAKLHRLSNHILLETEGQPTTFPAVLSWGLRVLNEAESILELYLRQKWSHRAGWRMVLLVNVLRIVCLWVIKREKVKEAVQTLKEFLVWKRRNSPTVAPDANRPEPTTRLIVPRVVTPSTSSSGSSVGWIDALAVATDAYGAVRQLLLAASTYLAFPAHRLGATAKIVPITAPPSSVRSLAVSLSPTWKVWRTFLLADLAALVASHLVQRYRRPIVVVDDSDAAVDADFSQLEPQGEEEATADERRVQEAMRPLTKHVFRDPFFSVVLKGTIYRHLVDGFVNRWIPLLGPLLANQIRYMLAMQQYCYLYTE